MSGQNSSWKWHIIFSNSWHNIQQLCPLANVFAHLALKSLTLVFDSSLQEKILERSVILFLTPLNIFVFQLDLTQPAFANKYINCALFSWGVSLNMGGCIHFLPLLSSCIPIYDIFPCFKQVHRHLFISMFNTMKQVLVSHLSSIAARGVIIAFYNIHMQPVRDVDCHVPRTHGRHGGAFCLLVTVGPCPGENPPSKHLSVSMSVLYHKRNPDFASSGMLNNRPDSLLGKMLLFCSSLRFSEEYIISLVPFFFQYQTLASFSLFCLLFSFSLLLFVGF